MADQFEETAPAAGDSAQQQKRGGGGGGRRGGRGGGGRRGGGGGQPREVLVSKALSKLLRHQAENAGLKLDEGGYAPLDKVLAYGPIKSLKVTFSDIRAAVTTSDKQRFALKLNDKAAAETSEELSTEPSDWLIRANQGHSIKVESAGLLTPITLEAGNVPAVVVHGTYFAFWKQIEASGGLKRMGRNHVHFATGLPGDEKGVVSGMRKDAEVLVYVDVERALREEEGIKWWTLYYGHTWKVTACLSQT
ncbi:Tpt1/KptA family RNA 2'-phosphotransferase [Colletotrichum nymphaeae SA-01]|uniref:2'-phosphotransferase n=1 Tax=Colletotrichum nymphaeae SA-01 TaxID=1460502 RepID=A0A135RP28_9PEZI|nr:Tpt1/KptA family RNA 2'-phosphotransferase [Colletotrichum nymphaeae SA-01]